jgi:hypothetical protein
MSEIAVSRLSGEEARSLTDEVKQDAERLWRKLVELYDGGAHLALGFNSWGDYFATEFGGSSSRAYQILDAGRVARALGSTNGGMANERQARALTPLLDQPDQLRDAWAEASASGHATSEKVREAVERRLPPVEVETARDRKRKEVPFETIEAGERLAGEIFALLKNYETETLIAVADYYELVLPGGWLTQLIRDRVDMP